MFWHCANLWFTVMQTMLFSECTVVLFGRCNLLNSRQLSFINQVETVVKSYKEQNKLITLFHDGTPSWIFNTNIVDISSAKVAAICEWQLHTSQELTFFFVEKLNASNLQYIWFFSSFVCSFEKPKETRSGFHVLANEKSWSNAVSKEVNR